MRIVPRNVEFTAAMASAPPSLGRTKTGPGMVLDIRARRLDRLSHDHRSRRRRTTGAGDPLSRGTASSGDSTIDFPRVARWSASDEMTATLAGGAASRSIFLSQEFLDDFEVSGMQPEPRGR